MNLQKRIDKGKWSIFIGILNKFQWIGFMISTDNPQLYSRFFLLEVRLLWIRFWVIRDL